MDEVEEENASSEDELLRDPFSTHFSLCASKPKKVLKVDLSEDTAPSTSYAPSTLYVPSMSYAPSSEHISCDVVYPNCHDKFPVQEIETHADLCAETSTCLPVSRRVYDNLMDIEDHVVIEGDAVGDVSDGDVFEIFICKF
jgi:hypothetical protein